MTVLVTGGTGFVGAHVVQALRARELPVRALVRDGARAVALASEGVELVEGDVGDPASLRDALEGCEQVVHLVAIIRGAPADFERVMAQGTRDLVARLEGKSSLGRLGLLIHSTAGFIDPGWDGHVTLELSNVANLPITIYPAMKIGQISFMQMSEPAETPYGAAALGSKYKGQRGPTASRYWQNFEPAQGSSETPE